MLYTLSCFRSVHKGEARHGGAEHVLVFRVGPFAGGRPTPGVPLRGVRGEHLRENGRVSG